jgi:hypothetical protein
MFRRIWRRYARWQLRRSTATTWTSAPDGSPIGISTYSAKWERRAFPHRAELPWEELTDPEPEGLEPFELPEDTWLN